MKLIQIAIKITFILTLGFTTGCNNPCDEVICLNDSTCINGLCECSLGYEGDNCENRLFLLKTIIKNDRDYQIFTYDDQNRISTKTQSDVNDHTYIHRYSYKLDTTKIEIINTVSLDTITHHYMVNSNDQTLTFIYNRNRPSQRMEIFSNHDNNCGYSFGESYAQLASPLQYQEINYMNNCNVTINTFATITDSLVSTIQIIMDDSEFIHQSNNNIDLDPNFAFITNKSNFKKITYEFENQTIAESISYESNFILNSEGLPIMEMRYYNNGNIEQFEFEYY